MRAPLGGLFRHVLDLVRGQADAGWAVGIVCSGETVDPLGERALEDIAPHCALGVNRVPISRLPGPADIPARTSILALSRRIAPDIVHGHGAKGGAHARLAALSLGARAVYSPHGGSLHYPRRSPHGFAFFALERWLLARTDLLIFVSRFEHDMFVRKVGTVDHIAHAVVPNGVRPDELVAVETGKDAADVLFVGELRHLKGIDTLLHALARSRRSATIVGDGPDRERFAELAEKLGLSSRVRFAGALPAREAFRMGRLLVIPSRAESMPYIVLEAAAARLPLIATRVGGIPEILSGFEELMVAPEDPDALAAAINARLDDMEESRRAADLLAEFVATRFTVEAMVDGVLTAYRALFARSHPPGMPVN